MLFSFACCPCASAPMCTWGCVGVWVCWLVLCSFCTVCVCSIASTEARRILHVLVGWSCLRIVPSRRGRFMLHAANCHLLVLRWCARTRALATPHHTSPGCRPSLALRNPERFALLKERRQPLHTFIRRPSVTQPDCRVLCSPHTHRTTCQSSHKQRGGPLHMPHIKLL